MRQYSKLQITLHWIIVVLVPIQYFTGGSIERTHHAVHAGDEPDKWDLLQHLIHNYCGIAIGVLMVGRLAVRLRRPVPAASLDRSAMLARALHWSFYAAIIGQALLGFIASYVSFRVAPLHVLGAWTILAMIWLHVAAALWHAVVRKDAVLDRMIISREQS